MASPEELRQSIDELAVEIEELNEKIGQLNRGLARQDGSAGGTAKAGRRTAATGGAGAGGAADPTSITELALDKGRKLARGAALGVGLGALAGVSTGIRNVQEGGTFGAGVLSAFTGLQAQLPGVAGTQFARDVRAVGSAADETRSDLAPFAAAGIPISDDLLKARFEINRARAAKLEDLKRRVSTIKRAEDAKIQSGAAQGAAEQTKQDLLDSLRRAANDALRGATNPFGF